MSEQNYQYDIISFDEQKQTFLIENEEDSQVYLQFYGFMIIKQDNISLKIQRLLKKAKQIQFRIEHIEKQSNQITLAAILIKDFTFINLLLEKGLLDYEKELIENTYDEQTCKNFIDKFELSQQKGLGINRILNNDKYLKNKGKVIKIIDSISFELLLDGSKDKIILIRLKNLNVMNCEDFILFKSKEFLRKLMINQEIEFYHKDNQNSKYLMCYCFLNYINISNLILRNGFCSIPSDKKFPYKQQFQYHQQLAKSEKIGQFDEKNKNKAIEYRISEEKLWKTYKIKNQLIVVFKKIDQNFDINLRLIDSNQELKFRFSNTKFIKDFHHFYDYENQIEQRINNQIFQYIKLNFIDREYILELDNFQNGSYYGDLLQQENNEFKTIQKQLVKQGLCYLSDKKQPNNLQKAYEEAIQSKKGIWENNLQLILKDEYIEGKWQKKLEEQEKVSALVLSVDNGIRVCLEEREAELDSLYDQLYKWEQNIDKLQPLKKFRNKYFCLRLQNKRISRIQLLNVHSNYIYPKNIDTNQFEYSKLNPSNDTLPDHAHYYEMPIIGLSFPILTYRLFFQYIQVSSSTQYQESILHHLETLLDNSIDIYFHQQLKPTTAWKVTMYSPIELQLVQSGYAYVLKNIPIYSGHHNHFQSLIEAQESSRNQAIGIFSNSIYDNDQDYIQSCQQGYLNYEEDTDKHANNYDNYN